MYTYLKVCSFLCWLPFHRPLLMYESVGEVLKLYVATGWKIDVVDESKVTNEPTMDEWWSWSVSGTKFFRNKSNMMSESKHPWGTPSCCLEEPPLAGCSYYSAWITWTSPSSMLKLLGTCHRPACQTLSNTSLNSMMLWNRSRWCCRFPCDGSTIEHLFYCAPAWSKTCLFVC